MSVYRYFSTAARASSLNPSAPALSIIVKQLSKFASHNEMVEYSQRPINYCYPNRMIEACSPSSSPNLVEMASNLHDQLLVRLAHCLTQFQSIPFLPGVNPTLLSLHERYLKLFDSLVKFPRLETKKDENKFFDLISTFVVQNNDVIGLLSTGCNEAQKYFKSYKIMEDFLDNVLRTRLSMRLLAEHYLELHKQYDRGSSPGDDDWRGAICMKFSPNKAIQQCIDDVSAICFETYSVVPHVQIEDNLVEPFPYFPNIVEYILRELLKNSMRALVESHKASLGTIQGVKQYFQENREKASCKISITSDPTDDHFTIAVRDHGGGITDADEQIFRYMFTGEAKKVDGMKEEEVENFDILSDFQERMVQSTKQMFGYGFGLPICRLYAQMFAGTLNLHQVSHIGTDAYLRLGFIHTPSEQIRI